MSEAAIREEISVLVAEIAASARPEAYRVWQRAPHVLEIDELESLALFGLASAAARWFTYCVSPDVRVLTADLRWVPAGSLREGQEIIGFDEYPVPNASGTRKDPRRYRRAVVTGTGRKVLPSLRVTLEDGRSVVCSADHQWLTYRRHGDYRQRRLGLPVSKTSWWMASELRVGDEILAPFDVWESGTSFEAGWLSGLYDGEGCVGSTQVSLSQNPGDVLSHAKLLLKGAEIRFNAYDRVSGSHVEVVSVGARKDALRLLGWLRPVRLMPKAPLLWEDRCMYNRRERCAVAVTGIEDVGEQEVVTLQTSTKTFLAEGLASHNCSEKGHDPAALHYFRAFCLARMRGAMLDYLRAQDWVTRSERTRAKLLRAAGQDRGLSDAQLAEATGMSLGEVRGALAAVAARPVSIDAEPHDVAGEDDVEGQAVVSEVLSAVHGVIARRGEPVRTILVLRYYHNMTVSELAPCAGVSEEEAAQLCQEAVLEAHAAMMRAVA